MRTTFQYDQVRQPCDGDIRLRRAFIIYKTAFYDDGTAETRWLEWAWIIEEYHLCISQVGDASWWEFTGFLADPKLQPVT